MKTLIMTVGLPQSGKSTWAKSQNLPMVNPDSIRLALHGHPFIGSAEPFVWAIARSMVSSLFLAGHDRVILDACNTTRKRRDDWRSKSWAREFRVFDCDVATCKQRAKQTCNDESHYDGLCAAIDRMDEQWEAIESEETS